MPATQADLASLASSHDIIAIGMMADEARRRRHGAVTTFVRVADVAAEPGAPVVVPPAAGEVRIAGVPADSSAAAARIKEVVAASHSVPVSGFSLADLEQLAVRERVTLRALLEELRAAGLELVAEAPFDRLQDRRRSIEEVNIAGLALARLTIHQLPSAEVPDADERRVDAAAGRRRDPRVRAAAAAGESRRADHRLRRCQARGAGAAASWTTSRRSRWTGRSTDRSWRRWR